MAEVQIKLLDNVRRCLAQFSAGSVGVVAVSGGPDSVALLRALLQETSSPLVVAHLNHQLRGTESDADEAFVRDLHERITASRQPLSLACQRLDVRGAADGDNLESAARRLRYDWLATVARKHNASWVVTGHTANDQAETVLHRLLRGPGLRGLAAIPARRELAPGIALVRPFLAVSREEVLEFLRQLDQPFRQDSTNFDRQYTRSRLRHDLLPHLASQFNPSIVETLCRLAEQAGEAQRFIEQHASALLAQAELPRAGGTVVVDATKLSSSVPLIAREALRLLWEREGWPLGEMGFEDWQRIAEVIQGQKSAVDLPGGVGVRRVGHVIQIK